MTKNQESKQGQDGVIIPEWNNNSKNNDKTTIGKHKQDISSSLEGGNCMKIIVH